MNKEIAEVDIMWERMFQIRRDQSLNTAPHHHVVGDFKKKKGI
jgi:hypothetical protein